MFDLGTIDAKQQLWRRVLGGWNGRLFLCADLLWRRHHVDGVSQGTAETLHFDLVALIQRDAAPALKLQSMRDAHKLILECCPGLPFPLCPLASLD